MQKVSIVIPVYNGANYLKDAIDSALAQTYENCEVIVVNDGSTDEGRTAAIAKSYGDKIRYFEKENGGVATAVNLGIEKMEGDYFAWLSHDDMFMRDKIERQINAIYASGNSESVCFGNFVFRNTYTGEEQEFCIEDYCDKRSIENGIYPILFGLIHFCTVLVSRERISKVGMCDERLKTTQDIEWLFRLLRNNKSIFIKEPLSIVRLHESQGKRQISGFEKEQEETHIKFMNSITDDEVIQLFGSRHQFFWEMSMFYKRDNNNKAFQYAIKQFNSLEKTVEEMEAIRDVKEKLNSLRRNGRMVVFCAGKYGKNLIYEMKSRDICIDFISDNDSKKWGKVLFGIHIIPPDELRYEDMIIVAKDQPDSIVSNLKNKGYINVMAFSDVMVILKRALPIYIADEWREYNEVDK